jgi:hypothetical protein
MKSGESKNNDNKARLEAQIRWWNDVYGSTNPTLAGQVGLVIAMALPYTLYYSKVLPEPNMPNGGTQEERIALLLSLQLLPALVVLFYVMLTGLVRIPLRPMIQPICTRRV